jgi:hypothetical protein
VACFSRQKSDRQQATIHHESTTSSPSKNHVQPPIFAKTPSKNAQFPTKNKRPDKTLSGLLFSNFDVVAEAIYWL